jgi:tRNA-2-methylthio-N6-dimethylallyladenosine synthase
VPAADKRRRLNALLAAQEAIGLERNRAWLGRIVEVLVDAVAPPRTHDHDAVDIDGAARLSGRSRQNKLVHLAGPASLVGRLVDVRIDHAGPYALRGVKSRADGVAGLRLGPR